VYIQPWQTRVFGSDLVMKGDQGIDKTMNYEMEMKIPRSELGSSAQNVINDITAVAAGQGITIDPGETVDVKFKVTGTFDDPRVSPMFEEGARQMTEEVVEQVQEIIDQKVEEVKEEAREEISREAENIMEEAREQAERVQYESKLAGDELKNKAKEEGENLIKQAGNNPLKKIAAETAANKLNEEAEKRARQLEDEARVKADNILKAAQEKADKLNQ
jgi:vacuolar-type H+-ATPase subunit H